MKRSEMISLIEDILLQDHDGYCEHASHISYWGIATDILDALQEHGMKPPVKKRCPVLLTEKHTWEPENDV